MKKIFLPLLSISLLAFYSCSSDDDKKDRIGLEKDQFEMYYEGKQNINATSISDIEYNSENEYVAKVSSSGVITAGRVGETNIVLENEEDLRKVKVTVVPKYSTFEEPLLAFGKSRAEIEKQLGEPESENESSIIYSSKNLNTAYTFYIFDDNDKLELSGFKTKSLNTNIANFLIERYQPVIVEGYNAGFINASTPEEATMFVALYLNSNLVAYDSYSNQTRNTSNSSIEKINELINAFDKP